MDLYDLSSYLAHYIATFSLLKERLPSDELFACEVNVSAQHKSSWDSLLFTIETNVLGNTLCGGQPPFSSSDSLQGKSLCYMIVARVQHMEILGREYELRAHIKLDSCNDPDARRTDNGTYETSLNDFPGGGFFSEAYESLQRAKFADHTAGDGLYSRKAGDEPNRDTMWPRVLECLKIEARKLRLWGKMVSFVHMDENAAVSKYINTLQAKWGAQQELLRIEKTQEEDQRKIAAANRIESELAEDEICSENLKHYAKFSRRDLRLARNAAKGGYKYLRGGEEQFGTSWNDLQIHRARVAAAQITNFGGLFKVVRRIGKFQQMAALLPELKEQKRLEEEEHRLLEERPKPAPPQPKKPVARPRQPRAIVKDDSDDDVSANPSVEAQESKPAQNPQPRKRARKVQLQADGQPVPKRPRGRPPGVGNRKGRRGPLRAPARPRVSNNDAQAMEPYDMANSNTITVVPATPLSFYPAQPFGRGRGIAQEPTNFANHNSGFVANYGGVAPQPGQVFDSRLPPYYPFAQPAASQAQLQSNSFRFAHLSGPAPSRGQESFNGRGSITGAGQRTIGLEPDMISRGGAVVGRAQNPTMRARRPAGRGRRPTKIEPNKDVSDGLHSSFVSGQAIPTYPPAHSSGPISSGQPIRRNQPFHSRGPFTSTSGSSVSGSTDRLNPPEPKPHRGKSGANRYQPPAGGFSGTPDPSKRLPTPLVNTQARPDPRSVPGWFPRVRLSMPKRPTAVEPADEESAENEDEDEDEDEGDDEDEEMEDA